MIYTLIWKYYLKQIKNHTNKKKQTTNKQQTNNIDRQTKTNELNLLIYKYI